MKTFPLKFPPKNPGVYAMVNRVTGHVYVGKSVNLFNRYTTWAMLFCMEDRKSCASKRFRKIMAETNPADWEFAVLADLPGACSEELAKQEAAAILTAYRKYGDRLVNAVARLPDAAITATPFRPARGRPCKTAIVADDGEVLSYRVASDLLEVKLFTLYKRLALYRKRGVTSIRLSDLKFLTDRWRKSPAPENPKLLVN